MRRQLLVLKSILVQNQGKWVDATTPGLSRTMTRKRYPYHQLSRTFCFHKVCVGWMSLECSPLCPLARRVGLGLDFLKNSDLSSHHESRSGNGMLWPASLSTRSASLGLRGCHQARETCRFCGRLFDSPFPMSPICPLIYTCFMIQNSGHSFQCAVSITSFYVLPTTKLQRLLPW